MKLIISLWLAKMQPAMVNQLKYARIAGSSVVLILNLFFQVYGDVPLLPMKSPAIDAEESHNHSKTSVNDQEGVIRDRAQLGCP